MNKRIRIILLTACLLQMYCFPCHSENYPTEERADTGISANWGRDVDAVIDGVFFKDGVLVYYPPSKEGDTYQIPDGTIGIHPSAFARTVHLDNLIIPGSCEYIGITDLLTGEPGTVDPFSDFGGVKRFVVESNHPYFSSCDGVLFTKDRSVLLKYPIGRKETQYSIPSGVIEIGDSAFQYSCLEAIIFPDSLRYIGHAAFYETALESVTLPEGLFEVGSEAFYGCQRLKHAILPETLLVIGSAAFEGCILEEVTLPGNLKQLDTFAFFGNPIAETSEVELPASLEYIGEDIFQFGYSSEDIWNPIYLVHDASAAMEWAITNGYRYRIIE